MTEALINFGKGEFEKLIKERGLKDTVVGVLGVANDEIDTAGEPLTLEALKSGTHPLLDVLSKYKNLEPEQRQLEEEEILTLFTNVKDFGKYDPEGGSFTSTKSFGSSAARMIPETIGAATGWKAGLAAAAPIAAWIPPLGPAGILARGAVLGIGALGGSIAGAIAASEAEDAIIGEKAPVVPSLEPSSRAGETFTMGLSLLASPWKFFSSLPKASTGALEFLSNYRNVSGGKFANIADDAFEVTAKNAGLSKKSFKAAQAARESATRGPMFGGPLGADIGFTRFNPAGFLVDPRKGPAAARVMGGIEGGISKSMEWAVNNAPKYLFMESVMAAGAGSGAAVMQMAFPYDDRARLGGELVGSLLVPLPAQVLFDVDYRGLINKAKAWYSDPENIAKSNMDKTAVKRIMAAIEKSEEYVDILKEDGKLDVSADEQFGVFIESLIQNSRAADGTITPLTTADLAETSGLPFSRTVRTIQEELSRTNKDLAAATGRGREELQAGAKNTISTLAAMGDPLSLKAAANIQRRLFQQNIIDNIDEATVNLMGAAQKVLGREAWETGSKKIDLSEKLYDVLKDQIEKSKKRENEIYEALGDFPLTQFFSSEGQPLPRPNVLRLLDKPVKRGGLNFTSSGSTKKLNRAIGDYTDDLEDFKKYFDDLEMGVPVEDQIENPVTTTTLRDMRSDFLEKISAFQQQGRLKEKNWLNRLQSALFQDLTGQNDDLSAAYLTATAFAKARNDVFSRTFLNKLQATNRERGLVMDPKELLDELFKGGNLATRNRIDAIQAAGDFLIKEANYPEEVVRLMDSNKIMKEALRDSLSKIMVKKVRTSPFEPEKTIGTDYVVDPKKLENFRKDPGTKALFEFLPELELDLKNVEKAQAAYDNSFDYLQDTLTPTQARKRKFSAKQIDNMYKDKAFQWVLQGEDPTRAVTNAIASERPGLALKTIFNMVQDVNARELGEAGFTRDQAKKGLKSAVINHALLKSNAGNNPEVLQKALFSNIPGLPPNAKMSLADFMVKNDLATEADVDDIQKAVKQMRGIEEAFQTNDFENVLFKNPSLSKLFTIRILGATGGGWFQDRAKRFFGMDSLRGGLVAEQTGSEVVQKLLLRGPETEKLRTMGELLSNPEALGIAMREIKNARDADKAMSAFEKVFAPVARQTGRRFPLGIGAVEKAATDRVEPLPEKEVEEEEEMSSNRRVYPPMPPTAFDSMMSAAPPPTPVPTSQPVAQGPVDRQRFAALFPNDLASGIIRSRNQGIGSLMG
jgi:hypothetical protein